MVVSSGSWSNNYFLRMVFWLLGEGETEKTTESQRQKKKTSEKKVFYVALDVYAHKNIQLRDNETKRITKKEG